MIIFLLRKSRWRSEWGLKWRDNIWMLQFSFFVKDRGRGRQAQFMNMHFQTADHFTVHSGKKKRHITSLFKPQIILSTGAAVMWKPHNTSSGSVSAQRTWKGGESGCWVWYWLGKGCAIDDVPDAPEILVDHFIDMPWMSGLCGRRANAKNQQEKTEASRFTRVFLNHFAWHNSVSNTHRDNSSTVCRTELWLFS